MGERRDIFTRFVPGHETEFPMALVVLAGLVTSTLLNLLLLPAHYGAVMKRLQL